MKYIQGLLLLLGLLLCFSSAHAQEISIKEETLSLDTYGYGKPNPVPILAENPKIHPYFKYEEYEHVSKKKDWKVVTLENDYIKVFVLPEIGGKVWGGIEKETGNEFLYKNKVVKFRNIAMRGPWTSGGIEFNFGIIGHHPATASPVDYLTRTNTDGSVSCIVGNVDLPSNTRWMVEIRLESDKAYFETNVSWYNASPLTQSYYNWMTAAAVATNDLEFFIPGNAYVEHNGDAHTWPIDDKGRNLSLYKNNTFGPSKSYHVVGEYNDFFGGYYHDRNFGFGQWAPYEEMPGQKLWLWDLSRGGGIWEDLLTDSDGQYIEFQAGRLFNQYFPGAVNPISQVGFEPFVMDTWSEIWFPYKEIGGMVDTSPQGVLNVEIENGQTYVGLNALQKTSQALQIKINGAIVFEEKMNLSPMEVFSKTLSTNSSDAVEVSLIGTELQYSNSPKVNALKRPFHSDLDMVVSSAEKLLHAGLEAMQYREYVLAHEKLKALLTLDPSHRTGHVAMAELEYRRTDFSKALEHSNTVLKMNTYDAGANYWAGISYRALGDPINALESLGWAARSMKYRSAAYSQMAEIQLAQKNNINAKMYAAKALTYNLKNVNALEVLLLIARLENDKDIFNSYAQGLLDIDPFNTLVALEQVRMNGSNDDDYKSAFKGLNEFEQETVLSQSLSYYDLSLDNEALLALMIGPASVKNKLFAAYLSYQLNGMEEKMNSLLNEVYATPINMVFPYRGEMIPVLEWAKSMRENWKIDYYLAQNYLAVGQIEKGKSIIKNLGDTPDSDVFYRFRAALLKDSNYENRTKDYQKALELNATDWKVWEEIIQFYLENDKYEDAYALSKKAFRKFKGNYNIEMAHAKALLNTGRFSEVLKVLEKIRVLPYEHASESREIYNRAHLAIAKDLLARKNYVAAIPILEKSKEWPENIGVGKPYRPDERMQDYLLAICHEATGNETKKGELLRAIVTYTAEKNGQILNDLFGLLALKRLGQQDKLDQLLLKLMANTEAKEIKSKAVLALYNNELEKARVMLGEAKVPEDHIDGLISSLSY